MMFCRRCGAELPDNLAFCIKCGAEVKRANDSYQGQSGLKNESSAWGNNSTGMDNSWDNNYSDDPDMYGDESVSSGNRSKIGIIVGVFVALVILVVVIVFVMKGCGNTGATVIVETRSSEAIVDNKQPSSSISSEPSSSATNRPSSSEAVRPSASASSSSTSAVNSDGPREVVSGYLKNFEYAMNMNSIDPVSRYLKTDSPIYITQSSYVQKDIILKFDTCEIIDVQMIDDKNCIVTARDSYYVQKKNERREYLTEECKYKLEKTGEKWEMTDFADDVKVLSRTYR